MTKDWEDFMLTRATATWSRCWFLKKIFLSDEAHFQIYVYVKKQNSTQNPHGHETPLYAQKVTVWSAVWPEGIIGPYLLFKKQQTTVKDEHYRRMITDYFWQEI